MKIVFKYEIVNSFFPITGFNMCLFFLLRSCVCDENIIAIARVEKKSNKLSDCRFNDVYRKDILKKKKKEEKKIDDDVKGKFKIVLC